jgi:hypothetical protein
MNRSFSDSTGWGRRKGILKVKELQSVKAFSTAPEVLTVRQHCSVRSLLAARDKNLDVTLPRVLQDRLYPNVIRDITTAVLPWVSSSQIHRGWIMQTSVWRNLDT